MCKGSTQFATPFIPRGWTRKLLVVRDHPNPTDDEIRLINNKLRKVGMTPQDVAFVPALRCQDSPEPKPSMTQIRACRPFLVYAIDKAMPERILAMGADAIKSLTNDGRENSVVDHRGKPLALPGTTHKPLAFATYSPAAITRGGYQFEPRIEEDVQRLTWEQTAYPENFCPDGDTIGFDSEFAPDKRLLDVATANLTRSRTWDLEAPAFKQVLHEARFLVGHSVSGDVDQLVRMDCAKPEWVTGENTYDTLLLARMADENRGTGAYSLDNLLLSYCNVVPWKEETEALGVDATQWPAEARAERCRLDAWAAVKLLDFIKKEDAVKGPVKFTHRVAMTLHRVELAGMAIDGAKFREFSDKYRDDAQRAKDLLLKEAQAAGMTEFVPTNDGHLRTLLFEKLGIPPGKKTDGGEYSVDKTVLKPHAEHPVVKLLLEFNKADKFFTTNFDGIRGNLIPMNADGSLLLLPVNINPLGARTGRRSSHDPNVQNWPKPVRQMVRSRFPNGKIGDHDYSRLEVVLMGWWAPDEKLLDYFLNGDGYIGVAQELWNKEIKKDTDEYRAAKSIVLGVDYNKQYRSIARDLWAMGVRFSADYDAHEEESRKFREIFMRKFPGVRRYIEKQRRHLLEYQQIVSPSGRVRHCPLRDGEDDEQFWHSWNMSVNFPIQSFASDVTGSALIDVEAAILQEYGLSHVEYHKMLLEKRWPEIPIISNEVHDDLVIDYPNLDPARHKRDTELVVETMRALPSLRKICPSFKIRPKVGVSITDRWCGGE